MSSTRKVLFSLVISMSAVLSGCGGGSNPSATAAPAMTPGSCAAGSVYSTQYGCMSLAGCEQRPGTAQYNGSCVPVGNSAMSNCQTQPGQAPSVQTAQYGCLPQGSCPVGQGSYVSGNTVQCIQGQMNSNGNMGSSSCSYDQIMTEKGCLPQASCPQGSGYLEGRCIPGSISHQSINEHYENNYDESYEDDYEYRSTTSGTRVRRLCNPKVKVRKNIVKVKYSRKCQ